VNYLIDKRNCQVLVLDNLISGLKKHIHKKATFLWYDIRENYQELAKILRQYQVEYVFNYAAEPYVPDCFERPLHFFTINAVAALNVLNACQEANIKAVLQVSSAEIYGEAKGKIAEDAPVIPHSTYGVSKVAADGLVQVRWREAKVPAIAMRQFNCVGERETHEYVIPEIISQLNDQEPGQSRDGLGNVDVWRTVHLGNNSERDFQYAGDAVRMAVELLEKGQFGEVYNMGSESTIKIYDLAKLIGHVMFDYGRVEIEQDPKRVRPWEIWHLQSDNLKLYTTIEARPAVLLYDALKRTVDYYRVNGCKWDW